MIIELKELIKRCDQAGCSRKQMLIITQCTPEELELILVNNVRTTAYKKASPSSLPNSFYISRFKQGKDVKEIAEELKCNLSGLYRVLKQRGISQYNYTHLEEEEDTNSGY